VGICVGAWAGGRRSCALMQSSGVGNLVNALGLVHSVGAPFFAIATMRGEWGEFNGWQTPMGQSIPKILDAANVVVNRAETSADVIPVTEASGRLAFNSYLPVFSLISQRATGAKVF
jgi:sulfopyruvate decarboxylase TPP-binding subunit